MYGIPSFTSLGGVSTVQWELGEINENWIDIVIDKSVAGITVAFLVIVELLNHFVYCSSLSINRKSVSQVILP